MSGVRTPQAATGARPPRRWSCCAAGPWLTRRDLAAELGLGSGATSDLVGRLRATRMVAERPAASGRPGRPTTRLHAHPEGPVVLAVDLRHGDWRVAACGARRRARSARLRASRGGVPARCSRRCASHRAGGGRRSGRRAVVGVAVPGLTAGTRLLDASMLGWREVELAVGRCRLAAGGRQRRDDGGRRRSPSAAGGRRAAASGARGRHRRRAGARRSAAPGGEGWPASSATFRSEIAPRCAAVEPAVAGASRLTPGCSRRASASPSRRTRGGGCAGSSMPRATAAERRLREQMAADLGAGTAGLVNALAPAP